MFKLIKSRQSCGEDCGRLLISALGLCETESKYQREREREGERVVVVVVMVVRGKVIVAVIIRLADGKSERIVEPLTMLCMQMVE